MPKSRFNLHKAGVNRRSGNRHDPIARSRPAQSSNSSTSFISSPLNPSNSRSDSNSNSASNPSESIIPVITKLPLPGGSGSGSESDLIWALSSISILLDRKSDRKLLLNPSHKLSSRLLNVFKLSTQTTRAKQHDDEESSSNVELRKESSGALRNYLIEYLPSTSGRHSQPKSDLKDANLVQSVLDHLIWSATQLGMLQIDHEQQQEQEQEETLDQLLQKKLENSSKPLDQLNRKERRQINKLNKLLEKKAASASASSSSSSADHKEVKKDDKMQASSQGIANPNAKNQDKDELENQLSLYMIMENCIMILWCLTESFSSDDPHSPSEMQVEMNQKSQILSTLLCHLFEEIILNSNNTPKTEAEMDSGTETGTGMEMEVEMQNQDEKHSTIQRRLDSLSRTKRNLALKMLDFLNSISENNPSFSIGFLGIDPSLLASQADLNVDSKKPSKNGQKNQKERRQRFHLDPLPDSLRRGQGEKEKGNLQVLVEIIRMSFENLSHPQPQPQPQSQESSYVEIFSIISSSIIRNFISSLSKRVTSGISVPKQVQGPLLVDQATGGGRGRGRGEEVEKTTLMRFEREEIVPFLMNLLEKKPIHHPEGSGPGSGSGPGPGSGSGLDFKGGEMLEIIKGIEENQRNILLAELDSSNRHRNANANVNASASANSGADRDPDAILEALNRGSVRKQNGSEQNSEDEQEQDQEERARLDSDSPLMISFKTLESRLESKILLMETLAELVGSLPFLDDSEEEGNDEEEWKEEEEEDEDEDDEDDDEISIDQEDGMDQDEEMKGVQQDEEMKQEIDFHQFDQDQEEGDEEEEEGKGKEAQRQGMDEEMNLENPLSNPGFGDGNGNGNGNGNSQKIKSNLLSRSPLMKLLVQEKILDRISSIIASLSLDLSSSFPTVSDLDENSASPSPSPSRQELESSFNSRQSLRQILTRLTSIQSNFLINFSNFASPPPPSTPLEADSQKEQIVNQFKSWYSSSSPSQGTKEEEQGQGGNFETFVEIWKQSFRLATRLAGLECHTNHLDPTDKIKDREFKDQINSSRIMIENSISNLWSLSRLFQSSKSLPLCISPDAGPNEIPMALIAAYKNSQHDSMRVKCLNTLGCLARTENVSVELNSLVGNFFIEVLKALRESNHRQSNTNPNNPQVHLDANGNGNGNGNANGQESFTSAESMVAVLDSLFDIYADENSHYDGEVFRKGDFKGQFRTVWSKVRAEARRIDKRKYPSLREKADEAAQNLMDFIKYRDGLGF